MMMDVAAVVAGTLLFFGGVYEASRANSWRSFAWSILAIAGIGLLWSGIVHLAIPDFFSGVPPR